MYVHMYTYKYIHEYLILLNYLVQIALIYIIQYNLTINRAHVTFTFCVFELNLIAFFRTLNFLLV